jgi:hypothetical protein
VVKVNSSCSSTAVQQGDSQDLHRTGRDETTTRHRAGQGGGRDRQRQTGRERRGHRVEERRLRYALVVGAMSASQQQAIQPASQVQSSPSPRPAEDLRGRGDKHKAPQGSDRRRSEAERVERAGQEGRKRAG